MSKDQMIDRIRQCNQSARPEFLTRFDEPTLNSYLRRLTSLHNQRGRDSVWVRDGSSPAVVGR